MDVITRDTLGMKGMERDCGGLGFRVWGLGFWVLGFGFGVWGLRFKDWSFFNFLLSGFWFQVLGFRSRALPAETLAASSFGWGS